jgi:acyl-coenzyme A synthetase/AMP-(fatty) acid ligase
MKGYWNDERQTAERIVRIDGRNYYRTGDICRWRSDGNLDFIGRTDEEIKLSGFRISLNEIRRAIAAAPGVKEGHPAVALHPTLGKIIVACFTATAEKPDEDLFRRLQAAIKSELPYYMVPSVYVHFPDLPKLPSGKTDTNRIGDLVDEIIRSDGGGTTRFTLPRGGYA